MQGLDLCERYYNECVKFILQERCGFLAGKYSCALIGWGSDVLGNDDEFSRDHEWGPRLYIFVDNGFNGCTDKVCEVLDASVPSDFLGHKTRVVFDPVINARVPSDTGKVNIDVKTYDQYIKEYLGTLAPQTPLDWLCIPENKLFEITSGRVFYDYEETLTCKLSIYANYYPDDVWKYRLAYYWQAIGWNLDLIGLCVSREDKISTYIALNKVLVPIIRLTASLNRRYFPSYTKWMGKEFYKLRNLSAIVGPLLEDCIDLRDVGRVTSNIEAILLHLIDHHNTCQGLPRITDIKKRYLRGFTTMDCQSIADLIHRSIIGTLKDIPIHGAADQYIINEDFLLEPTILKKLRVLYQALGDN